MNRDAEVAERFLAWLLQVSNPTDELPSGGDASPPDHWGGWEDDQQQGDGDRQPPAAGQSPAPNLAPGPSSSLLPSSLSFSLGELSTVQDYIYTLLKRRLRIEIEKNPPLFPWETELQEYPLELPSFWGATAPGGWEQQLSRFQGPIPLPSALLHHVFNQAQALVQATLKSGVKLVRMVDDLFPGETESLQHLAGVVLMSPSRSGSSTALLYDEAVRTQLPDDYERASLPQQMVVSLLAAHNVLDWFTLRLGASQHRVERQWETALGPIQIICTDSDGLVVEVDLPGAGQIHLEAMAAQLSPFGLSQQREDAGKLTLILPNPPAPTTYALTITLTAADHPPLHWAIAVTA